VLIVLSHEMDSGKIKGRMVIDFKMKK